MKSNIFQTPYPRCPNATSTQMLSFRARRRGPARDHLTGSGGAISMTSIEKNPPELGEIMVPPGLRPWVAVFSWQDSVTKRHLG